MIKSWEVSADRPAGGYVLVRVDQLFALWWCYERGRIKLADMRLWFALHEVAARRCIMGHRRKAKFTTNELLELTGQRRQPSIRASLRRLEQVGLAKARQSKITFPRSIEGIALEEKPGFDKRLKLITNHRRRIPIPRRILRWLACGSRRVLIAATLGHLLRLMYLRNGRCRADGNCKASWLAAVFAIDVRSVKQGRRRLIECGLLNSQEMPQWYRNRYGWRGFVNLQWPGDNSAVTAGKSGKRPPLARPTTLKRSPPRQNQELSSRDLNQQPESRADGLCRRTARSLGHVHIWELHDVQCIERLFRRAVARRLVRKGERLNVFAAAEHALRVGARNPPGLFAWLVQNRCWDYVTQGDEDAARLRLRGFDPSHLRTLPKCASRRLLTGICFPEAGGETSDGITHIRTVLQRCLAA